MQSGVVRERPRLFGLLLIAMAFFACRNFEEIPYTRAMANGNSAFLEGDLASAERHFTEALEWAEKRHDSQRIVITLGYLGRTLDEKGRISEAESFFVRRVEIAMTNAIPTESQAETFLALGIHYSKHGQCAEVRNTLVKLGESEAELKYTKEYGEAFALISDLIRLKCSG